MPLKKYRNQKSLKEDFKYLKPIFQMRTRPSTATDVLIHRAGVCRDFTHLGIALCRALGIPARMVVGYVEIEKFLPDFHAIFEAGYCLIRPVWRL